MTGSDVGLGGGEDPKASKPSVLDYAAKLASLLALALAILLQLTRKHTPILWAFLAVILLLVAMGLYPSLKLVLRRCVQRRKDRRVAALAFRELGKFVRQFGEFVSTQTSDTLHYVLLHEVYRASTQFGSLGIPALPLWYERWYWFGQRVKRQRPSAAGLELALKEFYSLVGQYNTHCVVPIFNNPQEGFRAGLTEATRSSLNSFQQRFVNFLSAYENFVRELAELRPTFQNLPWSFEHPKPL